MAAPQSLVNPARNHLLSHGLDSELDAELYDILNCNVNQVVRQIKQIDINILGQFMNLPLNEDGSINILSARQQITRLLINHPSFRSQNPSMVCACIAHYFSNNPNDATQSPPSPAWAQAYLNSPRRINAENGIPNPPSFD